MEVNSFQYFNHFFLSISLHLELKRRGNGPKLNEIKWPTKSAKGKLILQTSNTTNTHTRSLTIFTISRNTKCKQMESVCKSEKYARRDMSEIWWCCRWRCRCCCWYSAPVAVEHRECAYGAIYTYNMWGVLSVRLSIALSVGVAHILKLKIKLRTASGGAKRTLTLTDPNRAEPNERMERKINVCVFIYLLFDYYWITVCRM